MSFFIDLFEYLMEEYDKNTKELIKNIVEKICEYSKFNCVGLLEIEFEQEDDKFFYDCNNFVIFNNLNIEFPNKIKFDKNLEFNKIISFKKEDKNEYEFIKLFNDNYELEKNYYFSYENNNKYIIFFQKNGKIENEFEIDDYIKMLNIIFLYKNKISNIDERKMHFIMNMSHEVRTPLNAIITMTDLIIKKRNENPENNKYLQIIRLSGLELMGILNNMLDYSKVITNKMKLKYEPISLFKTIKTLFMIMESEVKDKKIDISFKMDDNIPDMIISDNTRLKQVLINILSNSIKYTKEGYVKLIVECIDEDKKNGNCKILFKVIDTGIGISSDKIDKVFDYFVKIENNYLSEKDGLGVGLAIAKHIISLMNGKIWIENNKKEQGTIMNITINFDIFKNNTNEDIVKDYFYNNKALILSTSLDERLELIKLFSCFKINPVLVLSTTEIKEYINNDNFINFIFINNSNLDEKNIIEINNTNNEITKILIVNDEKEDNNNSLENNILHDYKIIKPITQEKILNILSILYTINKFKTKGIENEVFIEDKKLKLNTYNHEIIDYSNIKVLVVEDNKQNQKCMEHILKFKQITNIDNAEDGGEALYKMENNKYNLVLMDIKIPVIDGITVVEKYKKNKSDDETFIVAVTAGISDDIKQRCFNAKMDAFLSKPVDIESFDKVIKLMLKKNKI